MVLPVAELLLPVPGELVSLLENEEEFISRKMIRWEMYVRHVHTGIN
jgi:hypothetical protein